MTEIISEIAIVILEKTTYFGAFLLMMLESMVAHGVDKLVFSSTAAVYGEPERTPILETDRTVPQNCYGETKLAMATRSIQLLRRRACHDLPNKAVSVAVMIITAASAAVVAFRHQRM